VRTAPPPPAAAPPPAGEGEVFILNGKRVVGDILSVLPR
jgi:hypothetical protein